MSKRCILWFVAVTLLICVHPLSLIMANDFFVGCRTRPACGKVCKLVCETTKITAVCYGCECEEICIPSHSRRGCKHCESCCGEECCAPAECECGDRGCSNCQDEGPECKFCWYDWVACGCAKPRTVKVLTKYQAEKEICWYHWEVVDAADCYDVEEAGDETAANGRTMGPGSNVAQIYKPAPPEAKLGDVMPLSNTERTQLTSFLSSDAGLAPQASVSKAATADALQNESAALNAENEKPSLMQKLGGLFRQ
jgi:hypothetical protein